MGLSGHCPSPGCATVGGVTRRMRSVFSLIGLLLVAAPSAVAAHCSGYELVSRFESVVGPLGTDPHAHHSVGADVHSQHLPLIPITTGALLVGSLALLTVVLAGRRLGGLPRIDLTELVVAQFAVVATIELGGLATGMSPQAALVVAGMLLQVPVAVAIFHLARHVRRLVARIIAGPRPALTAAAPAIFTPAPLTPVRRIVWATPGTVRGPPVSAASPNRLRTCVAG